MFFVEFRRTMNDPYEREIARLQAIYDEVLAQEAAGTAPADPEFSESEESSAEENINIPSDHDTDTEQEPLSDEDEGSEEPQQSSRTSNFFIGKDGTKWRKEIPPHNVRTRRENIIRHLPGVLGAAKNALSPYQCWLYYFEEITDMVVMYTNLYIQKNSHKYKDKYDVKETSNEEMKALFGLLYLAGSQHGGRKHLHEFYGTDGLGSEIFTAAMSFRRMRFLLRFLRFDNTDTREERRSLDKLAPVREIVDNFNQKCKIHYSVGEFVTLDEMLLGFRGRCSFKMYIPNKPTGSRCFQPLMQGHFSLHI